MSEVIVPLETLKEFSASFHFLEKSGLGLVIMVI